MEKRYVVPDGMLKAAVDAMRNPAYNGSSIERWATIGIEAAMRWLDAKLEEMDKDEPFDRDLQIRRVRDLWTSPEPEVPEAVKDLLYPEHDNSRLIEAYNRGRAGK